MSMELQHRIAQFVLRTATLVDQDQLETWLECFHENSSYMVIPRENLEAGHGIGLMRCDNKNQLVDRILVLRHASKFNPHWDRHIVSGTLIGEPDSQGVVKASTAFMVVQTLLNGTSSLFCAGSYEDEIQTSGDQLLLRKRLVVLDSFTISNCLATPL